MSYSDSFPTQRPKLNLVFNGGSDQLDSRISFSRADTPPTYAAPSAVHYWSNEKSLNSENLLLQSQDLDTTWTRSYIGVPTGSQIAPDGTSTAWLLTCNSGTAIGPRILQPYSVSSNTEYTMVAHLKAGTASHGWAVFRSDGTYQYAAAMLDFSAGTISVTSAGMTSASGTVTALGSNWFRVTVTATTSTSVSSPYAQIGISDGTAIGQYGRPSWNPAGTETMYAWGVQLSTVGSKVYDSPTTTQISREYSSTLKSVANAGDPRFEYDPTDGQSEGLLIEQQKSNLALNSNDFTNATWNKQRVTVTPSAAIGPDGQLSASLIAENTDTTTIHFMLPTAAITSGYSVGSDKSTHSVFAKYAGRNLRMTDGYNPADGGSTIFDLQNGTVVSGGGTIQSCGNGWYRCSVTMTMSASTLLLPYIQLVDGTTWPNASDAGDGYSGILLFGLQTEQQSMSSYITTGSSAVTKSADSCSVDLSETSYRGGPVSIVIETPAGAGEGYIPYLFTLSGGDQNFYAFKNTTTASASDDWRYQVGGTGTTVSGSAGSDKIAIRWDTGDVKAQFSTGVSSTNSGAVETAFTDLKIGMSPANLYQLNGNFKRLSLYSVALSDTELATLVD